MPRLRRAAIEALEQRQLITGVPVADPGFANPDVLGGSGYAYNPTGTPWTFGGGAGIEADGSAWGAPTAPDGDGRAAFIQNYGGNTGTVSESVSLSTGTYSLAFDAALRNGLSANPIQFSVDGSNVGSPITPASGSTWTSYTTDTFTISTAGQHTIAFSGTGSSGDCDSFIDEIGGPAYSAKLHAIGTVGQVALSWNSVNSATSYNIYRSTSPGGEGSTPYASSLTTTSYSDTSVSAAATYYYTITAVIGGTESAQGNEVSATASAGSSGIPPLLDPGFANPNVDGNSSYQYNPTGTPWTFSGRSGLEADGSPWGAPNAPDGDGRGAFIQYYGGSEGSISQSVYLVAGTYSLTFDAAQRGGYSVNPIQVSVDSSNVGSPITPASASTWTSYTTNSFTISTTGQHTIAFTGTGNSGEEDSFIDAINSPAPPAAPTGFSATGGVNQIALSWSAVGGATSYELFRSTSSGGEGNTPYESGLTGTTYTDASLGSDQTYYYTLAALNGTLASPQSTQASATTAFGGPSSISAVGTAGQILLNWAPVTGAISYDIFRSSTSGGEGTTPYQTGVTNTFFSDTSLSPGTSEYYTVVAVASGGDSLPSAEASATTEGLPAAPASLTAVTTSGGVSLVWTPSSTALTYNIYRGTSSGGEGATPIATGDEGAFYTDTPPAPDTTYYYFVTPVNAAGEGSPSNETSALTVPAAPTISTATAGDTTISLAWPAVTGATSYNLYQGTGPGQESSTPEQTGLTGTTFTDTGLDDGTAYYYTLTAVNASGESIASAEVTATPLAAAPTVATAAAATLSTDGTTVTLTTLGSDAGGESNLTYDWAATSPTGVDDPFFSDSDDNTAKDCTATLFGAGSYTFTVTITNNNQLSTTSTVSLTVSQIESSVAVTAPSPAIAPSHTAAFTASALDQFGNPMPTQPSFTWAVATGGAGGAIDSSGNYTASTATTGSTTITATTDDTGAITGSAAIALTPTGTAAPGDVCASPGNGENDLSWDTDPNATSYLVFRGTSAGGESATPLATVTTASYSDTSLTNGDTYYYTVAAINSLGTSATSAEVSATPLAPPAAPSSLSATEVSSNEINLSWTDNSSGAGSFLVERSDDGGTTFNAIDTVDAGTTTYQDTSVSDGSGYVYEVAAYNTAATSATSSTANATTPFAAPDNFTATAASTSENDLSWINESQVATGFTILRGTPGFGYSTIATITNATTSTYADTSATSGTPYQYEVKANDGTLTSATSTSATVTTNLLPPASLTISDTGAAANESWADLSWSAVTGATGYAVERKGTTPGDDTWAIVGGSDGTTYRDASAIYGNTYNYEVVAYDDTDRSDPSSSSLATVPMMIPAGPGVTATPLSNTTVEVTWTPEGSPDTSYEVDRYNNATSSWQSLASYSAASSTYSYVDTSLSPNQQYYYQVIATNSAGSIAWAQNGAWHTPDNSTNPADYSSSGTPSVTLSFSQSPAIAAAPTLDHPGNSTQPGWMFLSRSGGDLAAPLSVNLTYSGDAIAGTDYGALPTQITFAAGQVEQVLQVTPLNDGPTTGKALTATITPSANYTLPGGAQSATANIVPKGLSIRLGYGQPSAVITQPMTAAPSTMGLAELHLTVPTQLPAGDTVTLSDNNRTKTIIYNLVGGSLTALTSTTDGAFTWSTPSAVPSKLYVAAVAGQGSTNVGDTSFTLSVSGGQTVTTMPATVATLTINSLDNPNLVVPPGSTAAQASAAARQANEMGTNNDWLVGQVVDLSAILAGPPVYVTGAPYTWTTPGNVAQSYHPDGTPPVIPTTLSAADKANSTVLFFWVANQNGIATPSQLQTVSLATSIPGTPFQGKVNYTVWEPVVSTPLSVTRHSPVGLDPNRLNLTVGTPTHGVGLTYTPTLGFLKDPSGFEGIDFDSGVDLPMSFQAGGNGKWAYVQKIRRLDILYTNDSIPLYHMAYYGVWQLDNTFPYGPSNVTSPAPQPQYDNPELSVKSVAGSITARMDVQFKMSTVFQPPDSDPLATPADSSAWVPVQTLPWNIYAAAALNAAGTWVLSKGRNLANADPTVDQTSEVSWDTVYDNNKYTFTNLP